MSITYLPAEDPAVVRLRDGVKPETLRPAKRSHMHDDSVADFVAGSVSMIEWVVNDDAAVPGSVNPGVIVYAAGYRAACRRDAKAVEGLLSDADLAVLRNPKRAAVIGGLEWR
jgi:hypothetical protein